MSRFCVRRDFGFERARKSYPQELFCFLTAGAIMGIALKIVQNYFFEILLVSFKKIIFDRISNEKK